MQAPVLTDDTKATIQRIVGGDQPDGEFNYSYFSGLYAAHRILSEAYPGAPMPDALHRALMLAMDACTISIQAEPADGPGAC